MIINGRDEYIRRVTGYVGDRNTDEDLSFIEDMSDTYDSISTQEAEISRLTAENEDLRRKYRERFSASLAPEDPGAETHEETVEVEKRTYEDLFATN